MQGYVVDGWKVKVQKVLLSGKVQRGEERVRGVVAVGFNGSLLELEVSRWSFGYLT